MTTAVVLTDYERIEIEELGIEILVPSAYARLLRRTGKPLKLNVQLDPEPSPLPLLTEEQQATLAYLREHGVTSAEQLSKAIGYSHKTIQRWCGKGGLLQEHGAIATTKGFGLDTR